MHTPDKYTVKTIFKHHTAQTRACTSKSTGSFLKVEFQIFFCFYFLATDVGKYTLMSCKDYCTLNE